MYSHIEDIVHDIIGNMLIQFLLAGLVGYLLHQGFQFIDNIKQSESRLRTDNQDLKCMVNRLVMKYSEQQEQIEKLEHDCYGSDSESDTLSNVSEKREFESIDTLKNDGENS